ncbi:DUF7503 family protein [Halorarum halobium]|nr:hypothetical protein [Halobaculum sp. XH14]
MSDNPVKTYLAQHPKACGAVFMMTMLLASAGNGAATAAAINGP